MSIFLNTRQDGSIALFIDGDLQFDQRDEKIYHEGLALPALHLANNRIKTPLKALIIGGGDGLTARELLKSAGVATIDLVDYSAEVLEMAVKQLAHLNQMSLADGRVTTHNEDAWLFVQRAIKQNVLYDLIVVDLTVARDPDGAKFHSVEWYRFLAALLTPQGVLASNCVSPTNTPRAFWSIFNSMQASGLVSLPYRVTIPSFRQLGYGPDWGFILASKTAIAGGEFDLSTAADDKSGRTILPDNTAVKTLFQFPAGFEKLQSQSLPGEASSNNFLRYLQNDEPYATTDREMWSALEAPLAALPAPVAARSTSLFLPAEIRQRLADKTASIFPSGGQELFNEVLALMPGLQPSYTRSMIAEFISDPALFLHALDIRELVNKLLARAAELPQRIALELSLLQEKLADWAGDYESLLDLGRRVVTTLAVVVILANFVFPDNAYGKGSHSGGMHAGAHRMGNSGWNHHWGNDRGRYGGWGRPNHWRRWGYGGYGYGYGGWGGGPYYYGSGPGYMNSNYTTDQVPDSQGNQYPVRAYVQTYGNVPDQPWVPPAGSTGTGDATATTTAPADQAATSVNANIVKSSFRLGPDVDVLSDGSTVVTLSDSAYLKVKSDATRLIDQQSGRTLISLYSDPTLTWHLSSELKHQSAGLKKAAQSKDIAGGAEDEDESSQMPAEVTQTPATETGGDKPEMTKDEDDDNSEARDEAEAANMVTTAKLLDRAQQNLGETSERPPEATAPPVEGAFELFNSAWADHDGKYVILKKADGSLVYCDGQSWYSDQGKTKLETQYPAKLKEVIGGYLASLSKDTKASKDSLTQELTEVQAHLDKLKAHLTKLQSGTAAATTETTTDTNKTPPSDATAAGSGDKEAMADTAGASGEDLVQFGTKKIPRPEAIRRMHVLIERGQKHLDSVQTEINNLPAENEAIDKLVKTFQS
jgi:spermidine synthase